MRRSTPTALLVAIVLLLAGGVATAVVRESRDGSSVANAPATTVPDVRQPPAQGAAPTVPTTASAAAPTTVALAPTTVAPPANPSTAPSAVPPTTAAAAPSGTASGAGPTSTAVPPPLTAMPNTGGRPLSVLGVLLVAAGLLGWRLSGKRRTTG